jgi:chromosome segregation ATPase
MQHEDCPYTEVWALKWRVQLLEKELTIVKKAHKGDHEDILQKLNNDKQELQQKIDVLTKRIEENKQALKDQEKRFSKEIKQIKKEHNIEIIELKNSLKTKDKRIESLENSVKEQDKKIETIMARLNIDNNQKIKEEDSKDSKRTLENKCKNKDLIQLSINVLAINDKDSKESKKTSENQDKNKDLIQLSIDLLDGNFCLFNKDMDSPNKSAKDVHSTSLLYKK